MVAEWFISLELSMGGSYGIAACAIKASRSHCQIAVEAGAIVQPMVGRANKERRTYLE